MGKMLKLTGIGIIAGIILAGLLKFVQLLTNNQAYILLFNTDYIPLIKGLHPWFVAGIFFHFSTCVTSVIVLFYILKNIRLEKKNWPYVIVYTVGSGMLFPLTALSERTPALSDIAAWTYWVLGHAIYSFIVGILVKKWI